MVSSKGNCFLSSFQIETPPTPESKIPIGLLSKMISLNIRYKNKKTALGRTVFYRDYQCLESQFFFHFRQKVLSFGYDKTTALGRVHYVVEPLGCSYLFNSRHGLF